MTFARTISARAALLAAVFTLFAGIQPGLSAVFPANDTEDEILSQIGVDEKPGAQIPLDAEFRDVAGKAVRLSDYFGSSPVILTLNYYECPMLCPMTFANLADTFSKMGGLMAGRDYRVVTVSFNPEEDTALAEAKQAETRSMLRGVDDPASAWVFLTGEQPDIDALAGAVGYRYRKVEGGAYAHPAVIMINTPDGRLSRYLYGVSVEPIDLRLALIEASGGRIGPSETLNRVLLFCYHYDPAGRKYQLAAVRIMTGLGVLTLITVGGLLLVMWLRERKDRRA